MNLSDDPMIAYQDLLFYIERAVEDWDVDDFVVAQGGQEGVLIKDFDIDVYLKPLEFFEKYEATVSQQDYLDGLGRSEREQVDKFASDCVAHKLWYHCRQTMKRLEKSYPWLTGRAS